MTARIISRIALVAALLASSAACAANYEYTEHYDYVRKPALADSVFDSQLQADTATCDSTVGVQNGAPSRGYRSCMLQHGWAYRYVTRSRIQQSSDPSFSSNAKVAAGHFIDHDNGMDCQNIGGAEVCDPPNGTVHYYDPDQGLNCTRTGLVAICSNM